MLVPADGLVLIPDGLTTLTAAALLTDGRTALGICDGISLNAGTPVLITGAAGGMGLLLVQLTTARGQPKLTAIRTHGADAAIDYCAADWTDRVLDVLDGDRPAVVLDSVGGEIGRAAFAITAHGGVFSAHGAASGDFTPLDEDAARQRDITIRWISDVQFSPKESHRRLRDVLALAATGAIAPLIGPTYPLQDAAEAHRRIEARDVIGKSLLLANGTPVR
ncbi:MAG: zinc-binding dehydrogenase [Solirubrobacteraceae bacterium]